MSFRIERAQKTAPRAVRLNLRAAARDQRAAVRGPCYIGEIAICQAANIRIGDRRQTSRVEDRDFQRKMKAHRQTLPGAIDRDAIRGCFGARQAAFGGQAQIGSVAVQLSIVAARYQGAVRRERQAFDRVLIIAIGEQFLAR